MRSVVFWNKTWIRPEKNQPFQVFDKFQPFDCLPAFGISPLRDKGRHLAWTNAYENDQIVKIQRQIWEGKWTF